MLGSELFGHKRGSFTGAIEDRAGLFKAADGGTIFLDEIGDTPESVQTRLLRVLDQGEIRRVGDDKPIKVDVRVIAATNRHLESDVQAGRFRKDLYFRLNVVNVALPPLRERREDVAILADHFLAQLNSAKGKRVLGFTPETLARLATHTFEGNVRELANIVERAHALADPDSYVTPDLLPDGLALADAAPEDNAGSFRASIERFEAQLIRDALARNAGNQTRTAAELGLSRRGLIDKLQRFGIR